MTVTVEDLKTSLGCDTDIALAARLGVERSTIAQWRRRGGAPKSWHYVLKLKEVEQQSLSARRRLFGDGDGYYIQMAALAVLEDKFFHWPEVTTIARGGTIQDWIMKASAYVILILGHRTCRTQQEYWDLIRELSSPDNREGLRKWLYP